MLTLLVWDHRMLALEKTSKIILFQLFIVAAKKTKTWWDESLAISHISKYVVCIKFSITLVKVLIRYIALSLSLFPKSIYSHDRCVSTTINISSFGWGGEINKIWREEGFGVAEREVCFSFFIFFFYSFHGTVWTLRFPCQPRDCVWTPRTVLV